MLQVRSTSVFETQSIAAAIAALARRGDLVLLSGDLGAGKTAFVQGFGRGLGVVDDITSPTFALVHSYRPGRLALHHADLYRLERHHELADLGLEELLDDGVVLVEWGEVVGGLYGDHLAIRLEHVAGDSEIRMLTLTGVGPQWGRRWDDVTRAVEQR